LRNPFSPDEPPTVDEEIVITTELSENPQQVTGTHVRLGLGQAPRNSEQNYMNNNDLADAIASQHELTKADARKLIDGVLAAIVTAASKGEEVSLNGFGKFKVKASPAREGRNPATGAAMQIAASNKLTFAPAKAVKDKLNG
jgi:DNA-binding protein HU-beta